MPQTIVNNKKNNFPKGIIYNNDKLIIQKNKRFTDPLILELNSKEHLFIEAEESSDIKIIIELNNELNTKQEYNLDMTLNPNSNVTFLLISQLVSDDVIINQNFIIKDDANLKFMAGFLNNKLTAKVNSRLVGLGSSVEIRAVAISSIDNNQSLDIEIIHEAKHSTGLMHNIAIASENGIIRLNGIERILQGSSKSDAYQSLKGITTSNEGIIEVNPILLIDEYDITAGHGATVGKLDEESIYYLMSRGLSRKEAEKLMINGFLRPIIDEITDEEIKNRFIDVVNSRL